MVAGNIPLIIGNSLMRIPLVLSRFGSILGSVFKLGGEIVNAL